MSYTYTQYNTNIDFSFSEKNLSCSKSNFFLVASIPHLVKCRKPTENAFSQLPARMVGFLRFHWGRRSPSMLSRFVLRPAPQSNGCVPTMQTVRLSLPLLFHQPMGLQYWNPLWKAPFWVTIALPPTVLLKNPLPDLR